MASEIVLFSVMIANMFQSKLFIRFTLNLDCEYNFLSLLLVSKKSMHVYIVKEKKDFVLIKLLQISSMDHVIEVNQLLVIWMLHDMYIDRHITGWYIPILRVSAYILDSTLQQRYFRVLRILILDKPMIIESTFIDINYKKTRLYPLYSIEFIGEHVVKTNSIVSFYNIIKKLQGAKITRLDHFYENILTLSEYDWTN
ncbi:hypothetical protein PHYBLDRAFT_60673 [Phycomyces blakesleeanus NRRL 1555(-)]|uniref:Uncharacterized protein n=1 Tax=Phycomyces blakesleeanus (strain ATCC 8743b / DSM 1359 / FGSC 10004 / NBRC 33097 / NRRL 1555) TaxID=763407 RepID=A0A167P9T5_PHYB8|nr:hypothetical protein PHYBLDRAFT_60673 [Phycomyces blakesleeanus NRRL 1555(-)]OAD77541.1 hypothetical protein PHYBLDRAFT_60673 [Phycomyces blakesleeanus NRRL 1555(-)]|eukprot:XP_018295581.1 hypothetical protein PHYBLDRAFT_60673 [Phycomyces blakesleeanus NRRL 1555(-)]